MIKFWENIETDLLTKYPASFREIFLRHRLYPIFSDDATLDRIRFLSKERNKLLGKKELLRQGQLCEELPNLIFKGFKI